MRNHFKVLIAAGVLLPIIATYCAAEEYIVRIKVGTELALEGEVPDCVFTGGFMPSGYEQRCTFQWIANEAVGPAPLWDANTFAVYTKKEMDKKLSDIERSIKQGLDHNGKVLDDTTKAILTKIDRLPVDLPMDAGFYKQMRERLKADIGAELDKARQGVSGPAQ